MYALCTGVVLQQSKLNIMKLNAGIITDNLQATKHFYVAQLGFGVTFENEWYLLLHTPGHSSEIAFLKPGLPAQAPIFQQPFNGRGVYLDYRNWMKWMPGMKPSKAKAYPLA